MTTPTDDAAPPGTAGTNPLADEARTLLGVVQDWAQRTMPERTSSHPGPECQWCPLCQFAAILRGEHPDVADRVAEAGAALAGALRSFLASSDPAGTGAPARPAAAPGRRRPRPGPAPRVQHITLDDTGTLEDTSTLEDTEPRNPGPAAP